MNKKSFQNRIAFGVWLNDFRSTPILDDAWPSVLIDQHTINDFQKTMEFLKKAGYTDIDLFGLLTNRDWPIDIESVLTSERKSQVEHLIHIIHSNGLQLIYGLGVYSWGFDTIFKNDPEVRGTNPSALCGSKAKSRELMEKVVDFIGKNFAVDGYHLEAADQGRCCCEKCIKEGDVDYYNRLNQLTADYVRSRWPEKKLLVNTSGYLPWGDWMNEVERQSVLDLGENIDIFIDGGNHGQFIHENDRATFVDKLSCDYGTSGGFWIYPPQRFDRNRWFLPYILRSATHLRNLYRDGGRSCELYLGPLNNPSTEMNLLCLGRFLQDVDQNPLELMEEGVEELYSMKDPAQRKNLVELFQKAEAAFFNNWSPHRLSNIPDLYSDGIDSLFQWSKLHRNRAIPGELFLDSLTGQYSPFPVYLTVHLDRERRENYRRELTNLLPLVESLLKVDGQSQHKIEAIQLCIQNTLQDIEMVQNIQELNQ
jgi:hypothetical protein